MREVIATRRFGTADQEQFAELSGDRNPIHMDAIAARRTQAGAPVVHGINMALWALDELIAAGRIAQRVRGLTVRFDRFVYVDSGVTLCVTRESGSSLRAELLTDGLATTTLYIELSSSAVARQNIQTATDTTIESTPTVLALGAMPGRSGRLPTRRPAASSPYRHLVKDFGETCVATLSALSTLVGMVCPGLNSIFSSFSIEFSDHRNPNDAGGLAFEVRDVDERFRMVEMVVSAPEVSGTVTAFVRQPPVTQQSVKELLPLIFPKEFSGTTALIVGGSRGLGVLVARMIAAGGGRVIVTYVVGEIEARELAAEIGDRACRILRYDARQDAASQLSGLDWPVDQLYYFATTQIFRRKAKLFDADHFAKFCQVYVDGFADICAVLDQRRSSPLAIFYPSSAALDEHTRDMTEYCMAKLAGEKLCADMIRFAGARVVVTRLTRVLTDQTATVMPVESSDAVEVMLPIIRRMHGTGRSTEPAS